MRVGQKYNGTGECKGYAQKVFHLCFGITPGLTKKPNNYLLDATNGMTLVGSATGLTVESAESASALQSLFAKARPGDFIQMKRGHGGSHSAIVYSVTSSGVTFLEANIDLENGIYKKTYSWSDLVKKTKRGDVYNQAMSVYTATSYSLK